MRFSYRIAFFSASLLSASSIAQHPLVIEKIKEWNDASPAPSNTVLSGEIMKSALTAQKSVGGCIPTSVVVDTLSPATGVRFVFTGILQQQLKNAWTAVVRHPNCGAEIARYNIVRRSDDSLYGFRINRGSSNANESLIGDTFPLAMLGAQAALRKAGIQCVASGATLGVTSVAEEESDLGRETFGVRYTGSWSEIWPITMCERTLEIRVRFTADGDGGAYSDIKASSVNLSPASR